MDNTEQPPARGGKQRTTLKGCATVALLTIPAIVLVKVVGAGVWYPALDGFYLGAHRQHDGPYWFLRDFAFSFFATFVVVWLSTAAHKACRPVGVWVFVAATVFVAFGLRENYPENGGAVSNLTAAGMVLGSIAAALCFRMRTE